MDKTVILTFITAILACSGFWTFLSSIVTKITTNGEIVRKVDDLSDKVDRNDAKLARTHILRFDDELYNGIRHSREYFVQTLEDIDVYERYCEEHHDFQNSYAVEAIKHIRAMYAECVKEHKFI